MSNEIATKQLNPIQNYIKENNYHKQLNSMLGKRANQFIVSVNNAFEDYLKNCTPVSVMKSAMTAAALDLPIEKNLGFAYLIPYKTECTFQLGYKGLIQLAQRTGKYKTINAVEIYQEQFKGFNPLTEEIQLDFNVDVDYSKEPVGYVAYFKLLNGFEKTLFWTRERCVQHAIQFSQSYKYKEKYGNIWNGNTNAMHLKTVLKQVLSKYGVLSVEMQQALNEDTESSKNDMPKQPEPKKVDIMELAEEKEVESIDDIKELFEKE